VEVARGDVQQQQLNDLEIGPVPPQKPSGAGPITRFAPKPI